MQDHGSLQFKLEENILFIHGCGPWNKEALQLFADNPELTAQKQNLGRWGVVINVIGDPIYTPDAAKLLIEYLKDEKKCGRVATAFILTDSSSPELGKWHITEIYSKADEQCQFFDTSEQAKLWLQGLLVE